MFKPNELVRTAENTQDTADSVKYPYWGGLFGHSLGIVVAIDTDFLQYPGLPTACRITVRWDTGQSCTDWGTLFQKATFEEIILNKAEFYAEASNKNN